MTIPLPYGISTASQWQLLGWRRLTVRTDAAAGGVATARFPTLATDEQWLIDRAVASCTSTLDTSLRLYDGSADVNRLLTGSDRGNFDEADYPGGLLLEANGQLLAIWTGASTDAVGTISVQLRLLGRS